MVGSSETYGDIHGICQNADASTSFMANAAFQGTGNWYISAAQLGKMSLNLEMEQVVQL